MTCGCGNCRGATTNRPARVRIFRERELPHFRELEVPRREHDSPQARKKPDTSRVSPCCSQASPWPDAPCNTSRPSTDLAARRITRLSAAIRRGIETTKPHANDPTYKLVLFAGSFDWHSAVHAHWALLAIARVRKDEVLERWLTARLTDKALGAERKLLASERTYEMPYGRAWLLLLLKELAARKGGASSEVASLTSETLAALLTWLETSPYPEIAGSSARLIATHNSWLFTYLLVAMSVPTTKDVVDRLRALRTSKMDPARKQVASHTHTPDDFLFLPAVQALIDRVDPAASSKPAAYAPGVSPPLLDPPLTDANAHSAGAAVVRIWPHAFDAGADTKACSRFQARMNELFSRPDQWADSFEQVSHWVPQFMWMALWLEAGRP